MPIATVIQVPTSEKSVAITFDDGPHPVYTPRALQALADHHFHATWFVLGCKAQAEPTLLNQICDEGHDIGTHSYDHVNLTRLTRSQIWSQLDRTKQLIKNQTGRFWSYLRPTYGAYNSTVLGVAESLGYHYNVLWSIDSRDMKSSTNQIITRVLSAVCPGAIIMMHESTPQTTMALPGILQGLHDRGYTCKTLTDLLKASPIGPCVCRYLTLTSPYMRGEDVMAVQAALNRKGFSPGQIDGIYGPLTTSAVREFQTSAALPVTGNVDAATYSALGIICPSIPVPGQCRILELTTPYMRGDDVKSVQTALHYQGFDPGIIDSIYGPKTEAAVIKFQTARGLTPDGIVGPLTYNALGVTCPA